MVLWESKVVKKKKVVDLTWEVQKVFYEAVFSGVGDGLIVTDESGAVIQMNAKAEEILGRSKEDLTGKFFTNEISFADMNGNPISTDKRPLTVLLLNKQPSFAEVVYNHPSNGKMFLGVTLTPVMYANEIVGVVEALRNISHAKEVDLMKTEFISLASHQLRTPLTEIKWLVETLLEDTGKFTSEQLSNIKDISNSSQRMVDLVNALLDISRIESGRIIVEPKPTDLKSLVDEVLDRLRTKSNLKKLKLNVLATPDLPLLNVDQKLIREVYQNLLTNAIKYAPESGSVTVTISQNQNEIISEVSDTGYGIPKAEQEKVFQRFFRGTNILKIETDGTGLGLYLVKIIIESSGGRVWFKSEEGRGSSFWFSLPKNGMQSKIGEVTLHQ